jgi:hypothetical protein
MKIGEKFKKIKNNLLSLMNELGIGGWRKKLDH